MLKIAGISTHLYHNEKLQRANLVEIASHGFEAVELFATRSHFDYHDQDAIRRLKTWLEEAGLTLRSVHAPITDVFADGRIGRVFSTAVRDPDARRAALHETAAALRIAGVIPFRHLVVHLGVPDAQRPSPDDNHLEAAVRSVEEICALAEPLGVSVALEVMGNPLSTAPALVEILERSFDGADLGICMDVGHAHMLGDAADAIDTASEYLVATHIHDNRRRHDDHLVPFEGSVNWAEAVMAFEKIGYDGVLMYEVRNVDTPGAVLERAAGARRRLDALTLSGWTDLA